MGNYNYSVGELTSMIKKESKMNLAQLGNTATDQNTYIWYYMTLAMWKYVALAFVNRTSDVLVVAVNGYVTFQRNAADIDDLYEQLRILTPNEVTGVLFPKRTSFDAPNGWWRESANSQIHIKGAGTYVMQYKGYPAKATTDGQFLEWPSSSYDLLMFETIGKIKESINDLEGAAAAYAIADKLIPILVKANTDAVGSTNGRPLSQSEAQYYRR
jgi:hypothetical protein